MATGLETTNFDWQNFYVAHLSSDITNVATDVFLDTVPTVTEGILVIDPDTPASSEVIFYNSKTATKVTCPANGRGYDGSTAIAHNTGTKVIMAPVGDMFRYIRTVATTTPQGWSVVANTPSTVAANGNRSYTLTFNAVDLTATLTPGMRLKLTRTVAAPTQCTSLNGTTQFYSKTSPAGMTFTNNFVVSAWVKLSSYGGANSQVIASRYNGTSGWGLFLGGSGQVFLEGINAGASNISYVQSYQSIPLNKWVHIAAQLDMATFTATPTTSYVMIDGVDTPATVVRGGTNPTALVQAGNLEIGSWNGGTLPFPGKIAQVAVYSAKVTEATILASMHQTLAGTETSLISAYSFNNSINDLNANANNLTPNGSAVATNADTPFGQTYTLTGYTNGTLCYGIITASSFSTNTTVTVQVPEGDTIPTSGGVSAASYSTQKTPYGFPGQRGKWRIESILNATLSTGASGSTWYSGAATNSGSWALNIPIGEWITSYNASTYTDSGVGTTPAEHKTTLSTTAGAETDTRLTTYNKIGTLSGTQYWTNEFTRIHSLSLSAQTLYYMNFWFTGLGGNPRFNFAAIPCFIVAECAYL